MCVCEEMREPLFRLVKQTKKKSCKTNHGVTQNKNSQLNKHESDLNVIVKIQYSNFANCMHYNGPATTAINS